jgi:hypothetical protein
MPRLVAIVDAKANSKSSSGCTLSSSGMAYSTIGRAKKPPPGRSDKRLRLTHTVQKPPANGCLKMVNEALIALDGPDGHRRHLQLLSSFVQTLCMPWRWHRSGASAWARRTFFSASASACA